MAEKYAVRNLRLCTKDCLCLYVCPTGATDTENSVIDAEKCLGCGACAEACPSKAISMMPRDLPPQQPKGQGVVSAQRALVLGKAEAELVASQLPGPLAEAVARSSRLMAEDLCREAGFMLPQSANARALLERVRSYPGVPVDAVDALLESIPFNEGVATVPEADAADDAPAPTGERWKCAICGYVHEGPLPDDFRCPRCGAPAIAFERVED